MSRSDFADGEAQEVQLMDKAQSDAPENEFYHCSAEWHLAKLSPICALIYPLILRVSSARKLPKGDLQSRLFFGSANSLAEYFGYSESQIRIGLNELEELGFILLVNAGKFAPNVYRVFKHEEWIKTHKEQCTSKVEYPWTGEGDTLGQALWVISGSKVRFHPNQIKGIRGLGFSEVQTLNFFAKFMSGLEEPKRRRSVPQRFYSYLAKLRSTDSQICTSAAA
jgi:hypothetical protein